MNRHDIVIAVKKMIYSGGEKYAFNNKDLLFSPGTRPIRRKYINSNDDVVRNDVLQIVFLEQRFKPHDVMWDIGSHYGHYSIFAASVAKGNNQVFSFEPDSAARIKQERNIQLNHLEKKVTVSNIAVSDHNGTLRFKSLNGNSTSHIIKDEAAAADIIEVQTKTLNTLVEELPMPTFVKIDTEGAEVDILSAGDVLLQNKDITFICELHPFAWDAFKVGYDDFTKIIKKHNRTLTLLDDKKQPGALPFYGTVIF